MRTSLNPLMYKDRAPFDWLETIPGVYNLILQPGRYQIDLCGGGGAGGANGATRTLSGGAGGGGGNGAHVTETLDLSSGASVTVTVPTGGLTFANGGNGGTGGSGWAAGGAGGGGGMPAIVAMEYPMLTTAYDWGMGLYTLTRDVDVDTPVYDINGNVLSNWKITTVLRTYPVFERDDGYTYNTYAVIPSSSVGVETTITMMITRTIYANGGGGGGGGGGGQSGSGYAGAGSGGGGGGGYYRYDTTTDTAISVPGAYGAAGIPNQNPGGNGNPTFAVSGGHGGDGGHYKNTYYGGVGGSGGGAGGGGGGGDSGGHTSSHVGGGGGGAGGDDRAHGGASGGGTNATSGTNPGATGVVSVNPDGESVSDGYGAGGNAGKNGYAGWVHIAQITSTSGDDNNTSGGGTVPDTGTDDF